MDDQQLLVILTKYADRLDVLESDRTTLARAGSEHEAAIKNVLSGLETLNGRLAEAERRAREKKVDWATVTPWAAQATADQWNSLVEWCDWLLATYRRMVTIPIYPCWPCHPGVVEELAALWESWLVARASMKNNPTDQMAYWHERLLHPTLAHMELLDIGKCKDGHKDPMTPPRITDRNLIPTPADASVD